MLVGTKVGEMTNNSVDTLDTQKIESVFSTESLPKKRFCVEVQPGAGHPVYTGNEAQWTQEGFGGCTPALAALNKDFPHHTHKLYVLNSMTVEEQQAAIEKKGTTSNITFICDDNGVLKNQFPHALVAGRVVYKPGFYMFDVNTKGEMVCVYANPERTSINTVLEVLAKPTDTLLSLNKKRSASDEVVNPGVKKVELAASAPSMK